MIFLMSFVEQLLCAIVCKSDTLVGLSVGHRRLNVDLVYFLKCLLRIRLVTTPSFKYEDVDTLRD